MKINDNYIIITQNNTIFFTTPIEPSLKEKIAAGVTDKQFRSKRFCSRKLALIGLPYNCLETKNRLRFG